MKDYEFLSHKIDLNFFEDCIKELKNPCGISIEIGVLRGGSSKLIMENYKKIHPSLLHFHIGVDSFSYPDQNKDRMHLQEAIVKNNDTNFIFCFLSVEDYIKVFFDGYPLYANYKKLNTFFYDLVHLDGRKNMALEFKQISFFSERINKNGFIIIDDIDILNMKNIDDYMSYLNFKKYKTGNMKVAYQKYEL
jgi:hypothetical protein